MGDRTKWYGQNKMVLDKMIWTIWYRYIGTEKVVEIFGIDLNSDEINTYLVAASEVTNKC